MKILKYQKKKNGKYLLTLEDGREFLYYEEVILQYQLLLKKEILESDLLEIHETNLFYDVYYVALKSIQLRMKSEYELRIFLQKKEYPEEMISKAISKLLEQGYLNDRVFARSYIHSQMITSSHGPGRIRRDLENKKIDSSIILEELSCFDLESQKEKLHKITKKGIQSNHSRGGVVLKQKIMNDCKLLGYDSSVISSVLSTYSFSSDPDLAKKEYEKLYQKYSKKYEGYELKSKIREKMFQRGLTYEEE